MTDAEKIRKHLEQYRDYEGSCITRDEVVLAECLDLMVEAFRDYNECPFNWGGVRKVVKTIREKLEHADG